jgi:hypothetical protein
MKRRVPMFLEEEKFLNSPAVQIATAVLMNALAIGFLAASGAALAGQAAFRLAKHSETVRKALSIPAFAAAAVALGIIDAIARNDRR